MFTSCLRARFEPPLGFADGLGEHVFEAGGVFAGHEGELAGEPVAGGVEGGLALAFGGAGSGGVLGILLIAEDLSQ